MRVGVVGVGHVGLVTAAALADLGHSVSAMDLDRVKIELLQSGKSPFYEPDLDDLIARQTETGRLEFVSAPGDAVSNASVVFICVGRPTTAAGDVSLTAVEAVGREVARTATPGVVVVEKSTVPPGTADRLRLTIARERPGLVFSVVANPEFLREGRAVRDTLQPDRIVVGADDLRGFEQRGRCINHSPTRGFPSSRRMSGRPSCQSSHPTPFCHAVPRPRTLSPASRSSRAPMLCGSQKSWARIRASAPPS